MPPRLPPRRFDLESLPVSDATWPPPPITSIPGFVPPGFTFQNYIDNSPPVNSHFMAFFAKHGGGKHVILPCKVLNFNEATKTAVVQATDGVEITVVDIKVNIRNPCIEVWGTPTAPTVLSAKEISLLPDDHSFDRSDFLIEYLMHPSTWGEAPPLGPLVPTDETVETS